MLVRRMEESALENFSIDGLDIDIHDVVSKLRFLTKIDENEKVNLSSLSTVQDSFATSIYRTLKGWSGSIESRGKTLSFIKKVSDDALKIVEKCFPVKQRLLHQKVAMIIITSLQEIKNGGCMKNLISTYKADTYFVSQIETFQKLLNARIIDLERRNADYANQTLPVESKPPVSAPNLDNDHRDEDV